MPHAFASLTMLNPDSHGQRGGLAPLASVTHDGSVTTTDDPEQTGVLKITSVELSSGETISVSAGLTVIVGPNNSGKSQLLREINDRLSGTATTDIHYGAKVTSSLDFQKQCDSSEFLTWMSRNYRMRDPGSHNHGTFSQRHFVPAYQGHGVTPQNAEMIWQGNHRNIQGLTPFLIHHMPAGHQGGPVASTSHYHVGRETPTNPVQQLFANKRLEEKASAEMRKAFGKDLTVHRFGGNHISLHVGKVLAQETPPPASAEYMQEIEALPLLEQQGDGIKSFMGIVLTLTCANYPVVLIDEPEAFLHPPQAYMLGQFLASQHDRGTQVIVATHSDDILRGIVSAKGSAAEVSVVRLTRSSGGNHAAQVHVDDVQRLYEDPLIKYYGILDGLFSHGVLLCEADSDCTYYRAVLESTVEALNDGHPATALDVHFAHCGGKSRIAHAVRALRAARVPVACAMDVDILQDNREFDNLVQACDGDPATFERDRKVVASAVSGHKSKLDKEYIKYKIDQVFEERKSSDLTPGDINAIKKLITPQTGWKQFKKTAKGLLRGDAAEAYDSLDKNLKELGIFLVPVGELEGFHKSTSAENKAAWLRATLESHSYENTDATQYVREMANFIWDHQDSVPETGRSLS